MRCSKQQQRGCLGGSCMDLMRLRSVGIIVTLPSTLRVTNPV
jgi:hypothetical protein